MKLSSDALRAKAVEVRKDIVKSLYHSQSGHPGGSLSGTDIATALYFNVMNIDPENPKMEGRDKFVLSKGHAAPLLYAVLAERGYFDKEELWGLRKIDSRLQGHPDMKNIPGVEMSTGSLGQGISCAVGMALAGKLDKKCDCCKQPRVYALLGDGELQEGLVWEAAMSAGHYHLDNLTAIVDWNGLQIDGKNDDVMTVRPIDEKFAAFGWDVQMIDGHDMDAILEALEKAAQVKGKPSVIVAKTVKGKGVSFMENNAGWHGKAPNEEQYNQAMAELEAAAAALK
ncbi:MAG: transketolase [Firmicutes bacterium]|nr:transketolase [Bacillota bacterium]